MMENGCITALGTYDELKENQHLCKVLQLHDRRDKTPSAD